MIPEGLERLQPLLLASRSPQRRAILAMLGIDFEVVEPAYDEPPLAGEPGDIAVTHARAKAASVEGRCVLGADTLVAVEGRVLGKPAGEGQAREYLTLLSGRTHTVHSGLCLRLDGVEHVRHAATDVTFARLERSDLDWYLGTGEWRDRAGAYAVQGRGAALVQSIAGDYQNVVGLPVAALIDVMAVAAVR